MYQGSSYIEKPPRGGIVQAVYWMRANVHWSPANRESGAAGEQVALAEIAVRRRLVGGAGLQRRAEFTRGDEMIALLQRQPSPPGVGARVERVERNDAGQRRGHRALVAGGLGQRRHLARRLDVGVVGREQQFVFLDRARPVVQLLGQRRHQRVRALGADRRRDQHRGALQWREPGGVAGRRQGLAERELRDVILRLRRRRGLQRLERARVDRLVRIVQRAAHAPELLLARLVERSLELLHRPV